MSKNGAARNVLSLFDGMSCGRLACDRSGLKIKKYYASEIDKFAIKVSKNNWPKIIHLGNIEDWGQWKINWSSIDLVIGGSPCQGFSLAGGQLAFDDPRSKLFFVFVDILNHIKKFNPDVQFMLENVRMKQINLDIISYYLEVDPVLINSSLVSAQNRERYYWTNWNFGQPQDKYIYLKDILESGVVDRSKSYCIDANYYKGTSIEQYIEKGRRQIAFMYMRTEEAKRIRKEHIRNHGTDYCPRVQKLLGPRNDDKMNCLTATHEIDSHAILDEKINYRKLTPVECERLQTVPDNYTDCVSNTQRYKMLGNGWTIDVIAHILKTIDEPKLVQQRLELQFFDKDFRERL